MKHILMITTVIIFFAACKSAGEKDSKVHPEVRDSLISLTEAQAKNAGIVTARLQPAQISSVIKVNGKIDVPPQNMVSVSVPLGGYLKYTQLLPGMHINKGEVIAVVEDQQYIQLQQDYLTAKAQIDYLESEYLRQKELSQNQASSNKVFKQAEAAYHTQKVLIASLVQKLQLAGINADKITAADISRSVNIYSPINGYVSRVNVNIGKYVSPNDVLFELINPKDIHLALKVFEANLGKLFIGQKVIAYTNNNPEKKYNCGILLIGKDIGPEGNTDVHCHFEEYDKILVPGTYMNAEIEVKNNKALVLPEEAIVRYASKQYIFSEEKKNKFYMMEVNTGKEENGFVEILSGGKFEGKECVVKGAYSILMSAKNKSEE